MRKSFSIIRGACITALLGTLAPALFAASEAEELSVDEITMELSNPVTALATFNMDVEFRSYQGDLGGAEDQSALIYNFDISVPVPLDNGKNILMRATIPINGNQPLYFVDHVEYPEFLVRQLGDELPKDRGFIDGHDHLGDIKFDIAYGGVSDSGFISMYGLAVILPTSQDLSSSIDQYQLGPEVAFGKVTSWGLIGATAKHMMRVSGEDAWDTNMTTVEVFFAYGLSNGWQVFSNPVIEYDWEASSDNKLALPIGGGISKTTRIGNMPLKLAFEAQHYIVSPDSLGPQWLFTFSFTPVFKNPFQK